MYVRNNLAFFSWKIILVAFCACGLGYHMRDGRWGDFNYYTVQSNAICLLYFIISIAVNVRRTTRGLHTKSWQPNLEKAVVFCITVTLLIYHFVLRPLTFKMGHGSNFYSTLNIIQHYIVPIMVIIDWLLLTPKGGLRGWMPVTWLLIPTTYLAYILLRAPLAGNIGTTNSPYPYEFINVEANGAATVAINSTLIGIGMLLLAYLIYAIDRIAASSRHHIHTDTPQPHHYIDTASQHRRIDKQEQQHHIDTRLRHNK